MKKILSIAFVLGIGFCSFGQQQLTFTNYLLNDYYFNPALPGSKPVHIANVGYRNQWVGFNGAPTTMHANYYGSVKNEMKHGYGASLYSDRTGLVNNTNIHLNYAYQINLTDSLRLGFGIRPGFMQYNVKLYDAILADVGDEVLTGDILSMSALDVGAGLHLYHEKFFVTLSMRQMFGKAFSFTKYNHGLAKHFTLIGGYNFKPKPKKKTIIETPKIVNEDGSITEGEPVGKEVLKKPWVLQPSILLQYVKPAPPQLTLMTKFTYDDKYWVGVFARTQDALGVVAGIKLWDRWSLGYGFDYSIGKVRPYNGGSHELMISFVTTKKKINLEEEDNKLNNSIFDENKEGKD